MPAHTHTQSPTRERENIAYISAVAIFAWPLHIKFMLYRLLRTLTQA